jgi:hypothetical protein
VLLEPYGEIYPTSHDANQAMKVKLSEGSDVEVEEDPVPISENILVDAHGETYPTSSCESGPECKSEGSIRRGRGRGSCPDNIS